MKVINAILNWIAPRDQSEDSDPKVEQKVDLITLLAIAVAFWGPFVFYIVREPIMPPFRSRRAQKVEDSDPEVVIDPAP